MRDAADMPELQEDDAAFGVHGIDHLAPALDLRLGIDAGFAGAAERSRGHRGGFGDEQAARRGALRVIFGVERPRRQRRFFRAHARQRRQREAMLELIGTDLTGEKSYGKFMPALVPALDFLVVLADL